MANKLFPPFDNIEQAYNQGLLHDSVGHALLGSATGDAATGTLLAEVNLAQDKAQPWVVTVAGMTYRFGNLTQPYSADNQVEQGLNKLVLQWGNGGAMEQALVDYPWTGCTFTVHGSVVRLYTQASVLAQANIPPNLKAWIAASGNRDNSNQPPTFTTPTQDFNGIDVNLYEIPKRARRYHPFCIDFIAADTSQWKFTQLWGGNSQVVKQDTINVPATTGWQNNMSHDDGFQLHPRATVIQIDQVNAGVPGTRNLGIIFDLDFG